MKARLQRLMRTRFLSAGVLLVGFVSGLAALAWWATEPRPASLLVSASELALWEGAERFRLPLDDIDRISRVEIQQEGARSYQREWPTEVASGLSWLELVAEEAAWPCLLEVSWRAEPIAAGESDALRPAIRMRRIAAEPDSVARCGSLLNLRAAEWQRVAPVAPERWVSLTTQERQWTLFDKRLPAPQVSFVVIRPLSLSQAAGTTCNAYPGDLVTVRGAELRVSNVVASEAGLRLRLDARGTWNASVGLCEVGASERRREVLIFLWGAITALAALLVNVNKLAEWLATAKRPEPTPEAATASEASSETSSTNNEREDVRSES